MSKLFIGVALLGLFAAGTAAAPPPLLVHEWGTFTSFQDELGRTIGGINVDDEPVPEFVHRLRDVQVFATTSMPAHWYQGAPACVPGATLRLETPVLYFYPPDGWEPTDFDVRATFAGGWLTEFYPEATIERVNVHEALDGRARGSLVWHQVRLDPSADAPLPHTDAHVWLAPRKVSAAIVRTSPSGQAEKYLFYRGIGHSDAPLVTRQHDGALTISLRENEPELRELPHVWVVNVAANGDVRSLALDPKKRTVTTPFPGAPRDGRESGIGTVLRELRASLIAQGLYADEADAMLETWRLSYFESPGLRVFFMLPRSWTDRHLPLEISTPAVVTRVMVGRVELVTPEQRAALRRLYALPGSAFPERRLYVDDQVALAAWRAGGKTHADLYRATNRPVPEALRVYESLGRFRDALLAHDWHMANVAQRPRVERVIRSFSACGEQAHDGSNE